MQTYETLKHSTWECKYHIVFIPKYRKKVLYGQVRRELGPVLRELARQKESEIIEGHLMADHVHRLMSIPPKYSVAQVLGFVKGKSAIHIARVYAGRRKSFVGQHFWARGYWVSTVGKNVEIDTAWEPGTRQWVIDQLRDDNCRFLSHFGRKLDYWGNLY